MYRIIKMKDVFQNENIFIINKILRKIKEEIHLYLYFYLY